MYDINFWKAAGERAIKTFAQAIVALMGTEAMGIHEFDWGVSLSTAAFAAVLSIATSLASANFGPNPGPSLVDESTHPDTIVIEVAAPAKKAAPKKAVAKKAPAKK